ncbi:tryptophan 7-halogenase [uncultured Parasphingorhabdus sp.]|uniref:tryptophan 7-halogenase n=1 Tax=uncultured Parasphingorhabdus sp. TaxID=2709694 RepID=UPI002AA83800|nr:tryptophan 7-halogenase [uncultured Parasphingorhabdus sp.]
MQSKDGRVDSVLVVGAGTAGLVSALMIRQMNPDLPITVLYSARIGHIMIGEGTFATTPALLHDSMGLDRRAFYAAVKPTPKFGARFLWGKNGNFDYTFEAPLSTGGNEFHKLPLGYSFPPDSPFTGYCISSAFMEAGKIPDAALQSMASVGRPPAAYHMENQLFVDFLSETCSQRNISLVDAEVSNIETDESGVKHVLTKDGRAFAADLFVDCSGFSGALIHGALGEPYLSMRDSLFCDKAVVGGWTRTDEPLRPYTTAETMNAGWCWQIEHRDIVNRGYVYCSAFIDDETAEAEFRSKNPKVVETRTVPFETRRIRRSWVGNTVAIGNANGFVEPLEATNIQLICNYALRLAIALSVSRRIVPSQVEAFNIYTERSWHSVRDFLAGHYKFNTLLDTPFWQHARDATPLHTAEAAVDYYREAGPDPTGMRMMLAEHCLFGVDGWLAILLGCGVPYARNRALPAEEAARMAFVRKVNANLAERGSDPAVTQIEAWAPQARQPQNAAINSGMASS